MSFPFRLKFLGTAGARFVVAKQLRSSAGTWIEVGGANLLLDPGPGTVVRCAKSRPRLDPTKLDAILLTHRHIDHSTDVNVMIEAMSNGGWNPRGLVLANAESLGDPDPVVFHYVRSYAREVVVLRPETAYRVNGADLRTSIPHRHGVEVCGVMLADGAHSVGFVVDTAYFPQLAESYRGVDVLVLNVVLLEPPHSPNVQHLSLPEAERLIDAVRPRAAVITHFGTTMLRAKPHLLAEAASQRLGIPVLAASDGMTLDVPELLATGAQPSPKSE